MATPDQFQVLELAELRWPSDLKLPSRFRLFVAANSESDSVEVISTFAEQALLSGAVYVCAWGRGCERFHDIVDECLVEDDLGESRFTGPSPHDTVLTTWHSEDSLEEALDFFARHARPTDGFLSESKFRLVLCVGREEWAVKANEILKEAPLQDDWL